MEANNTYISFDTAEFFNDSNVKSKYMYTYNWDGGSIELQETYDYETYYKDDWQGIYIGYPAYTWQEILWEYPQEFFGEVFSENIEYLVKDIIGNIIYLLLQKKYDEADKYFRDNCILIKK